MTTTWKDEIEKAMAIEEESWDDIVHISIPDGELEREFSGETYGSAEGHPFTAWTRRRVYFPVEYDGMESVASAPRDPSDELMFHVG